MNRSQFEGAIAPLLELVYPGAPETARAQLLELTDRYVTRLARDAATSAPTQGTAVLITYADALRSEGEAPLATLRRVLKNHVGNAITDVHLLPVFPSTSDDGFAVVDYRKIDPSLGDWSDVAALSADALVLGEHSRLGLDRDDLLREGTSVLGSRGFLVRGRGELVELRTRQTPLCSDHLSTNALVRRGFVPVRETDSAERVPSASDVGSQGNPAHDLGTPCDHKVVMAGR